MLVKTIARKTLELKNHKIDKIKETPEGTIEIYISPKRRRLLSCKNHEGKYKVVDQLPERRRKHVSLWGREVVIIYSPCRVMCHGKLLVEDIPWARGKIRITTPLIAHIGILPELLPWKQVAKLFHVHWNTVKNAVEAQSC